jgi:hypothetical protein
VEYSGVWGEPDASRISPAWTQRVDNPFMRFIGFSIVVVPCVA